MIDYYLEGYSETIRKARKDHRCYECRGLISKGENYIYASGIGIDGPEDFKTCLECKLLFKQVDGMYSHADERPGFGELQEYIDMGSDLDLKLLWNNNCRRRGSKALVQV
jgi:hypothetical protein